MTEPAVGQSARDRFELGNLFQKPISARERAAYDCNGLLRIEERYSALSGSGSVLSAGSIMKLRMVSEWRFPRTRMMAWSVSGS